MRARKTLSGLILAAATFSATNCTVGPDFVRPEAPQVRQYARGEEPSKTASAEGVAQSFGEGVAVPTRWWQLFNSDKLDPVVKRALGGSPNLKAALSTLRQSQENLCAGYGVYYPQLNATFGASRIKSSPVSVGVAVPGSIFNLFTLSAAVSYVLDVFGGERRTVEGLRAQVDYERFTVLAAYLALTGNVVNTVIAQAAYRTEVEATLETVHLEKEQVAITQAQAEAGTVPYVNLLSLQSQLAATEATLPPLAQHLSQAEHLLATLSGEAPATYEMPKLSLSDLTLPASLPKTLPSALARQRPDILQSEALLHVASANVGVATAALYPSFTLSGALGANHSSIGDIFSTNGNFWNYGLDLAAPLFRGGTLSAQKRAAAEAYRASLEIYRQTVLGGISQVADALRALEHDAEALQAHSRALSSAREAMELFKVNFSAGTASYLQLLVANTQYFQAKIGFTQAMAQRLQDTVALYVALGGGWWNEEQDLVEELLKKRSD